MPNRCTFILSRYSLQTWLRLINHVIYPCNFGRLVSWHMQLNTCKNQLLFVDKTKITTAPHEGSKKGLRSHAHKIWLTAWYSWNRTILQSLLQISKVSRTHVSDIWLGKATHFFSSVPYTWLKRQRILIEANPDQRRCFIGFSSSDFDQSTISLILSRNLQQQRDLYSLCFSHFLSFLSLKNFQPRGSIKFLSYFFSPPILLSQSSVMVPLVLIPLIGRFLRLWNTDPYPRSHLRWWSWYCERKRRKKIQHNLIGHAKLHYERKNNSQENSHFQSQQ